MHFPTFPKFEILPIRIKLTIWYTLSFMVVLAISFVAFYLVTRNLLLNTIDDSLKSQVEEIVYLIEDQRLSPSSKEFIFRRFQAERAGIILILDATNRLVAQSQTTPLDPQLLDGLVQKAKLNRESGFLTQSELRFYIVPLQDKEIFTGTIIVGDSISEINQAFSVLINTLILVFLVFLIPLTFVSFLEADISLAPLRELGNVMNTITTRNMSGRVKIINPQDEVGEVSTAINNLLDRLQTGFERQRQLIHDVSHQLKTPLTAMRSDIEIALTKVRKVKDYDSILHDLLKDADRIGELLKDMMNFAWASTEEQERFFQNIDLSAIMEEISEITQQLGLAKKLSITTDIEPNIRILGQKEKVFQIFLNLIENAIKYSKTRDHIYIKAQTEKDKAKIIIKDTGMGILKKDLPNIFERFYRGQSNIGEGSGLGLSIAAALVKAHKGTIAVASQRQKGSTFLLTFPLLKKNPTLPRRISIQPIRLERPHVRTYLRNRWKKQP